jgi:hypothetical protein
MGRSVKGLPWWEEKYYPASDEAELVNTLSEAECIPGKSYGYIPESHSIWVDKGCDGEFKVGETTLRCSSTRENTIGFCRVGMDIIEEGVDNSSGKGVVQRGYPLDSAANGTGACRYISGSYIPDGSDCLRACVENENCGAILSNVDGDRRECWLYDTTYGPCVKDSAKSEGMYHFLSM